MTNEKYNGWTNYETWKVNLELLDGMTANELFGGKCSGDDVEGWVWEILGDVDNGFARSCVQATLAVVNWNEIAEHLNED